MPRGRVRRRTVPAGLGPGGPGRPCLLQRLVIAEAPLSEVTTYARALSSMTGGQGSFAMDFARYDLVPGNVQKEIVDKAVLKEEEVE